MSTLHVFLTGASTMGYAVAAIFFARFWYDTRDRLFALFGVSFLALATNRGLLTVTMAAETRTELYLLRLAAFVLIVVAIVDKNRRGGDP